MTRLYTQDESARCATADRSGGCRAWPCITTWAMDIRCSGAAMPDVDIETADGTRRVFRLLHQARPVLLNFGQGKRINITPWAADRPGPRQGNEVYGTRVTGSVSGDAGWHVDASFGTVDAVPVLGCRARRCADANSRRIASGDGANPGVSWRGGPLARRARTQWVRRNRALCRGAGNRRRGHRLSVMAITRLSKSRSERR
jgi:hypothetical protein